MKMQNVSLDDIVPNPWRDMKLYPVDADHVSELRESIDDHGFFGGVKGRRRNGRVELGCGHQRIAAARKAKLDSIPIFIDDLDDDQMLRLMVDENALQAGTHPGAVLNEVAAVTRRLIEGLMDTSTIVEVSVKKAFDGGELAVKKAVGKLRNGADVHLVLGENVVRRYLGQGNPERSHRSIKAIREAITTLKQSGRYDDIIDEAVVKYPQPATDKPAKNTAVTKSQSKPRRKPVLDERCSNVFPNDHQFNAFREAVTSTGAKQVIPVDKQYALAKEIMGAKNSQFQTKAAGAPYIKRMVQAKVQEGLKQQRDLNKEEKERYLSEQREERIASELRAANTALRSLVSALARLMDIAEQFPAHPQLGGFSARLDMLVGAIQQFSKKLR